jgi:hypothetical protein
MKTGTNELHGSLYGFTQPSWLAANNFFNNRAGIPVQSTKLNQYGVTVGGPVVLPKVYNGRNKLFWFFAFEKLDDSQPNTKFLTVPTDAERQGDFSALLKLGINSRSTILIPVLPAVATSFVSRSCATLRAILWLRI